jgi:hypothetical protein
LQTLSLFSNQLSGEIPPELSRLTSLQTLDLFWNQLSGKIPTELAGLTRLQYLDLSGNQLSGEIPTELADLTSLRYLDLFWNQLSGEIPSELVAVINLQYLDLSWNQLSEPIPPEIAGLTGLQTLDLSCNRLSGAIPPEIAGLTSLERLYLYSNRLSGEIPPELCGLTGLQTLHISGNRLSGEIPPEIGSMTGLQYLFLAGNKLIGAIPSEIGNLTNLLGDSLDLRWNALHSNETTLVAFLSSKQAGGDWQSTQTVAPEGVTVTSVGDRTVWLEWTQVTYTEDNGGYEVSSDEVAGGLPVSGGWTAGKAVTTFPVTGLQPGLPYDLTVSTFTGPHPDNQSTVVSEPGTPIMATTSNLGCNAPEITVTGRCPYLLSVVSTHDSNQWSTGETSGSISVEPVATTWYWVKTAGPGPCEEAEVVSIAACLFCDDFESGDTSAWSAAVP